MGPLLPKGSAICKASTGKRVVGTHLVADPHGKTLPLVNFLWGTKQINFNSFGLGAEQGSFYTCGGLICLTNSDSQKSSRARYDSLNRWAQTSKIN